MRTTRLVRVCKGGGTCPERVPPRTRGTFSTMAVPSPSAMSSATSYSSNDVAELTGGSSEDFAFAAAWLRRPPTGRLLKISGGPDPFALVAPELESMGTSIERLVQDAAAAHDHPMLVEVRPRLMSASPGASRHEPNHTPRLIASGPPSPPMTPSPLFPVLRSHRRGRQTLVCPGRQEGAANDGRAYVGRYQREHHQQWHRRRREAHARPHAVVRTCDEAAMLRGAAAACRGAHCQEVDWCIARASPRLVFLRMPPLLAFD